MKTIEEIKGACKIEDGDDGKEHWVWQGAMGGPEGNKVPYVWAPYHTKSGTRMQAQSVARAIRHIETGKPIRSGLKPYRVCNVERCVNPACSRLFTHKQWGEYAAKHGLLPQRYDTAAAVKKTWDTRGRKFSDSTVGAVFSSGVLAEIVAEEVGMDPTYVRKIRRGAARPRAALGSFAGLLR